LWRDLSQQLAGALLSEQPAGEQIPSSRILIAGDEERRLLVGGQREPWVTTQMMVQGSRT
jgi:hypothetical protein